jgi:hypothetical protein
MKKTVWISILLVAGLALAPGCTNKEGETEAPVFITVEIAQQPIVINVGVLAPILIPTTTFTSHLKNASQTDPQGFAGVTLESYRVHFRRLDGGTRVPPDQTLAGGGFVPSGGTSTVTNLTVLPAFSIQQSPFDQLLPFNGGIDRETGKDEIDLGFDMTFFGHTVSGQRVQSETTAGVVPLEFRFLGSASTARNTNR